METTTEQEAFMEMLGPVDLGPAACWPWPTGRRKPQRDSYVCRPGGGSRHRQAYELFKGPIPDEHEIDHVRDRGCRTRRCVNPAHLDAVTHSENIRRSMDLRADLRRWRKVVRLLLPTAVVVALAGCYPTGQTSETPSDQIIRVVFDGNESAVRVADCESSLDPSAVSPGGGNHGLFQIATVHRQEFEDVTGQPWSLVLDPYWNTVYAKHLYDEQGWRPWSCRWAA